MFGNEKQIIIAGHGGQGIVLAGNLLARACIFENKHVTGMVAYGAEMRGGTAYATIIISDEPIASPCVEKPNAAIILNQPSLDRFEQDMTPGAVVVLNVSIIERMPARTDIRIVPIEASHIAEELGNSKVVNIVALGAFIKAAKPVSIGSVEKAIEELFAEKHKAMAEINKQALLRGYSI